MCQQGPWKMFHIQEGFLFLDNQLCMPKYSTWEAILFKNRDDELAKHLGRDKTLAIIKDKLYWPSMKHDVERYVKRCRIWWLAKTWTKNFGLHKPLPIPNRTWTDVSLHFLV